eukprot:1822776-Amphidinium_carterae.1
MTHFLAWKLPAIVWVEFWGCCPEQVHLALLCQCSATINLRLVAVGMVSVMLWEICGIVLWDPAAAESKSAALNVATLPVA